MKNRIIEICELGQPQSIIHRENEPITELIRTEVLIKELNEAINYTHSCTELKCDCGNTEDVKNIPICASCYNPHTGEW